MQKQCHMDNCTVLCIIHVHTQSHARTHARTHTRTHARTHARTHTRTHLHLPDWPASTPPALDCLPKLSRGTVCERVSKLPSKTHTKHTLPQWLTLMPFADSRFDSRFSILNPRLVFKLLPKSYGQRKCARTVTEEVRMARPGQPNPRGQICTIKLHNMAGLITDLT